MKQGVKYLVNRAFYQGLLHTRNVSKVESMDSVRPASEIPGPKGLPLLGTALMHKPGGELHDEYRVRVGLKLHQKYGPIVREKLLHWHFTHIFHAEDIEKVLRNEGKYPWRLPFDAIVHYRQQKGECIGLAHMQGKEWFRIRSQVQTQMLRPRTVASYLSVQAAVADDLVTRVRRLRNSNNKVTDFVTELNHWALESIAVVCFNTRLGALEPDLSSSVEAREFVEAVKGAFKYLYNVTYQIPTYKVYHDKAYRQYAKDVDVLSRVAKKYINLTKEREKQGNFGGASERDNLLNDLLKRPQLSRDEVHVMITSLLFAGVDTTANLLAFCLYNIATNPKIQEKLQAEIDEKLPRGIPLTENAFDQMPYLKAVVKETSRFTPVAGSNVRKLEEDIVIQGYNVPAGDIIFIWPGISSMSDRYFDDPETFRPERWIRDSKARDIHPFSVLPFGYGPRMCVGRRFAEQETYLGITKLLQEFNIEHDEGFIGMTTKLINVPAKPFNLRVLDRV